MASTPSRGLLDASPGPVVRPARETYLAALESGWADPSRLHHEGRTASRMLDQAREIIASAMGLSPPEVTFHGSADAATRTALTGLARARRRHTGPVVVSAVEHSSILRLAAAHPGGQTVVPVDHLGRVDRSAWRAAVGPGSPFAVLQQANAEVGTTQPLPEGEDVPLVVDVRSSLGWLPSPDEGDVLVGDAASFGGPPLGILGVRTGTTVWPLDPLSPHERGLSIDPPDIPRALAAAEAWRQVAATADTDRAESHRLVEQIRTCAAAIPDVEVLGDPDDRLPHVVTVSALYVDGEALVRELDRRGLAVASGSACTADTLEPSHVLAAMGALTHGNVRVTLAHALADPGRAEAVVALCDHLPDAIASCREAAGVAGL